MEKPERTRAKPFCLSLVLIPPNATSVTGIWEERSGCRLPLCLQGAMLQNLFGGARLFLLMNSFFAAYSGSLCPHLCSHLVSPPGSSPQRHKLLVTVTPYLTLFEHINLCHPSKVREERDPFQAISPFYNKETDNQAEAGRINASIKLAE